MLPGAASAHQYTQLQTSTWSAAIRLAGSKSFEPQHGTCSTSKGQRESPAPCWRAAKPWSRAKGCTCTCGKYNTAAKPISSGVSKSHGSSTFTGGRYSWTVQLDSPDAMYKALCCCPGGQRSWTPAVPALQHNQRALTERAAMPSCNTQLDCPSTLLLSLYMLTQALRKNSPSASTCTMPRTTLRRSQSCDL